MDLNDIIGQVRNGAWLLLQLRSGGVRDWPGLCRVLGLNSSDTAGNTIAYELDRNLKELHRLGLVEFKVDDKGRVAGEIRVSERWTQIQTALGMAPLEGIASLASTAKGLAVEPVFGRPAAARKPVDIFVLMPFDERLDAIYEQHLLRVAKRQKLTMRRGDDIFSARKVMDDIWTDIHAARLLIADCTRRNANVFYEIGLAHALGKEVILITQSEKDMPFDLRHHRFIEYAYTPEGMKNFERSLERTIVDALESAP